MATQDNPDFQTTVTITLTPPTADNPDWQQTISGPGGSFPGGGGYASLSGTGETVTPGDLTQSGGFTVDDAAGHGITMISTGNGGILLDQVGAGGITLSDNGATGINIAELGGGPLYFTTTGTATIGGGTTNIGGAPLQLGVSDLNKVIMGFTANSPIGFYGATPVTRPAAPVTLADVIAALQALGLVAP